MKKTFSGITLGVVLVSLFVFTGTVFAQVEVPPETPVIVEPVSEETLNLYHDERITALVDLTGLSVEEIEDRLAAGETAYDIAMSMDVSLEDFFAIWSIGGFGRQVDGLCGGLCYSQGNDAALQTQLQTRAQDGSCLYETDCAPQNLNTTCEPQNLQDGSGAVRRGRSNR